MAEIGKREGKEKIQYRFTLHAYRKETDRIYDPVNGTEIEYTDNMLGIFLWPQNDYDGACKCAVSRAEQKWPKPQGFFGHWAAE